MNSFQWYPSESAPIFYPIEILSGVFILENGLSVNFPLLQFVENGWGQKQSIYLVGEDQKSMPIALKVTWMSFAEQKIYSGVFDLDPHEFRKAFEEGFITPFDNNRKPYDFIVLGLAPLGCISIWLNGDGLSKEIVHTKCEQDKYFKVESVIGDSVSLTNYIRSRINDYQPVLLEHADFFDQKVSDKWSVLYRQEVNITLQVISFIEPFSMKTSFFNGEVSYFPFEESKVVSFTKVPNELQIRWIDFDSERERSGKYIFSETIIFEAVKKLSSDNAENLTMVVQLSEVDGTIRVVLKNASSYVHL